MKRIHSTLFILLLTTSGMASDLARSFKDAAALAVTQDKDRATRIYSAIDLHDYYEKKYGPIFSSCLNSTEHRDTSPFSFIVAIGTNGRVLRLYTDHETNIFACVRPSLQQDEFPHPPVSPYYLHVSMSFSK
jgi:hypothetical protein